MNLCLEDWTPLLLLTSEQPHFCKNTEWDTHAFQEAVPGQKTWPLVSAVPQDCHGKPLFLLSSLEDGGQGRIFFSYAKL